MTKEELITKQQLKIEKYKKLIKKNKDLKRDLYGKFFSIGEPLNDNRLQFNTEQQAWCIEVAHLVEKINQL